MPNIGSRIKAKRNAAHLSQTALAGKVGVSLKQVYKWEVGRDLPSLDKVSNIAAALGVSVNWLITGKDANADDIRKLDAAEKAFADSVQQDILTARLRDLDKLEASLNKRLAEIESNAGPPIKNERYAKDLERLLIKLQTLSPQDREALEKMADHLLERGKGCGATSGDRGAQAAG